MRWILLSLWYDKKLCDMIWRAKQVDYQIRWVITSYQRLLFDYIIRISKLIKLYTDGGSDEMSCDEEFYLGGALLDYMTFAINMIWCGMTWYDQKAMLVEYTNIGSDVMWSGGNTLVELESKLRSKEGQSSPYFYQLISSLIVLLYSILVFRLIKLVS